MMNPCTRSALLSSEARERLHSQRGQGMVEYGLILILVAAVVIASLLLMPGPLNSIFNNVVSGLKGSNP